jgi:hypothetical protein
MGFAKWIAAGLFWLPLLLRAECPSTPAYSACDISFDLNDAEAKAHPNPYTTVEIHAEFRSPKFKTVILRGFWDGGRRMVIRFTPTEAGEWTGRVTSNVQRFEGQELKVNATASEALGFIRPANVHHWQYTENLKPHLWMGDTSLQIASMPDDFFHRTIDTRSQQKFTHIRGVVTGSVENTAHVLADPDRPDVNFFRQLDERVRYMNQKGLIFDAVLGNADDQLRKLLPEMQQRDRFVRFITARYGAFNVTWQIVQEFESYQDGRLLMKELGLALKKYDAYGHPRSTHTRVTSAPLLADGWMDYVSYQSAQDQVGAIEHQLFPSPFVNLQFASEDSGAGKSGRNDVDPAAFRHRLWNATMNGQYPTFSNTGTAGGSKTPQDPKWLDSPGAKVMKVWFDLFNDTRHWELEPYFDVDGGRCVALEGIEYIMYVENPGPVEVRVERHGYDVLWLDPASGETVKEKNWKGEKFASQPPDSKHDWVLFLSREGKKESMANSYKFESREILLQDIEQTVQKTPFKVVEPSKDPLSMTGPQIFSAQITRPTRATRSMMYLWEGEATIDEQGFRVLGTGAEGTLQFPPDIAKRFPAVLNLRVYGMNANGKVYQIDKVFSLDK